MKYPYWKMASGIYLNYLLLGMINIILSSNMSFLSQQLGVERTDISSLISVVGIGHLLSINVSGKLSDRYGRKPLIVTAVFLYMIFLIGIPFTAQYKYAMGLALIAGICNSLLDSGSYPALNEGFPNAAGTVTVLLKAFISIGAVLLPIIIAFIITNQMFYGYSFFVPAALFLLSGLFLIRTNFPDPTKNKHKKQQVDDSHIKQPVDPAKLKFWKEGVALILNGFASVSLFNVVQIWLPTFGQDVLHLSKVKSVELLSYYGIGGILSVLLLAILLKRLMKPITAMVIYPCMALITLIVLQFNHNPTILTVVSFFLGFSMSGIFQLTATVMMELFSEKKGASVSYVSAAASIAFIVVPFVTSLLTKYLGVSSVFIFDICLACVSVVLGIYIFKRYKAISVYN
ncbi:MFS transporter [Heyndrickxia shackletonii]|uniref:MFS transporter n=1 Tax=Heyndrickxia shackletonii TaxID=157838 RepID=A0A0Q3WUY0_9BACI|nr:MFS transporter [Heyndrickxia shackletonii]KQL52405.1 MFS transporter [Heyndrickxia shackletonii]NEY99036.1 MFS transporter [Heyndrickxia shackletonii]